MVYDKAQLEQIWIDAGGDPAAADIASAVALAESGGKSDNVGDQGTSFGPWQIHTPAHPQYDAKRLIDDVMYNAKAAVAISNNGTDWTAWTTYNTGAYRHYLDSSTKPSGGTFGGSSSSSSTSSTSSGGHAGGALAILLYIVLVSAGLWLIITGARRTAGETIG